MNYLHKRLALILVLAASAAGVAWKLGAARPLWAAAALVLAVAGLRTVYALNRRADELIRVARRLAEGDFGARVRDFATNQPSRLGRLLNTVAERFEATFGQLSHDRAQLATILDNIVEAVAAVGPDSRLKAVNPALRALFALDEAGCLGRPFIEALRHHKLDELLGRALKARAAQVEEVELLGAGERVFEAHAAPLMEEGRLAGALLVLHDITRIRKLEKMRREFVANVSHELRTPLASIRAFAETLREGALDDKAHRLEFVEAIEKDALRLTALVDDLLDLSAIESGRNLPLLAPVDLMAILADAAAGLKPLAAKRGVTIEIVVAPELPRARADARQIRQVFFNLLDNAIKFNREGGRVTVSASADEKGAALEFRDTGHGIPETDLPRVFERFYRVDKARAREEGGTGLGLAIVKHIVEAHRGSVSARSRLDEGSVFRVELPL